MIVEVRLRWSGPLRVVRFGPVTGDAELAVTDTSARSAIALVDALLPADAAAGVAGRGQGADLAVADRDRVLAAVHRELYGDRIDASLTCSACAHPYDVDFSLSDLVRHREPEPGHRRRPGSDTYRLGSIEFRPLTGRDELAVLDADADDDRANALLQRLIVEPASAEHSPAIDADMRRQVSDVLEQVAPLLSAPLAGACPECDATQTSRFDIHSFLLQRLLAERPGIRNAVHLIAARYHWSRAEILGLDRDERDAYVALIAQHAAGRRSVGGPR